MMYLIEGNVGPNQWVDIDRTMCEEEASDIARQYEDITGNSTRITIEDGEG